MTDIYEEIWKIGVYMVSQYENIPSCEVCGSIMSVFRFVPFVPLKEPPTLLYQCPDCKFISRNYSLLERGVGEFYTKLILPNRRFYSELTNKDHKVNYCDLLSLSQNSPIVLDLGCGVGGLEYFAKDNGGKMRVISFDICKETTDYAATQGITVYPVDITEKEEMVAQMKSLGLSKVDGIYCANTIEHLQSPASVLRMWAELLKEDGFLYLVMPTMDYVFNERLMYESLHFSYWTEDTFTKLINKIGLKVKISKVFDENNNAGTGSMKFVVMR